MIETKVCDQCKDLLATLQLTPASSPLLADPQPPLPEEMAAAPACERCGCTEWYMRVDGTWLRRCYFEIEGTTGNLASEAFAKGN